MIGTPGETRETAEESIAFCRETGLRPEAERLLWYHDGGGELPEVPDPGVGDDPAGLVISLLDQLHPQALITTHFLQFAQQLESSPPTSRSPATKAMISASRFGPKTSLRGMPVSVRGRAQATPRRQAALLRLYRQPGRFRSVPVVPGRGCPRRGPQLRRYRRA